MADFPPETEGSYRNPEEGYQGKMVELAWENARMVLDKDRERIRRRKAERSELSMR